MNNIDLESCQMDATDYLTKVNETVIQIFGIRRSGNHAIISWIMDSHDGAVLHLNDVKNHYPNPYDSFCYLNVKGLPLWKCKPRIHSYLKHKLRREEKYTFAWWDPALKLHYIKAFSPKACLIVSHEDQSIKDPFLSQLIADYEKHLGTTKKFVRVLLLRDAYNLFASLIKANMVNYSNVDFYINLYKEYAELVSDNIVNANSLENKYCPDYMFINYNDWLTNSDYRQKIAQKIGFFTNGERYLRVPKEGGGSTFDAKSMDGRAHNMKVLERWKIMIGTPLYEKVISDKELIKYSDHLFGKVK